MRLTHHDIVQFAAATGDNNPIHWSEAFARWIPFGRPIAHGVLASLAAIEEAAPDLGQVTGVDIAFHRPVLPDIAHRVTAVPVASGARLQVYDGSVLCLDLRLTDATRPVDANPVPAPAAGMRREPAVYRPGELTVGTVAGGRYFPPPQQFALLARRWPGAYRRLGDHGLRALAWSGYLAGMELPGQAALLCRLGLVLAGPVEPGERSYTARVVDVDDRFDLITVCGELTAGGTPVAMVETEAITLRRSAAPSLAAIDVTLQPTRRLAGHTALVVGGSRGLGAAVALGLAGQGGRVLVGHRHDGPEIGQLAAQLDGRGGTITAVPGDAADPAWATAIRERLAGTPLDLLVLSAAPTIGALAFEPATIDRLGRYVADAVALVAAPLAGLLEALAAGRGRCLLVSSAALVNRPAPWPHYVSAKAAVEGLVAWAATQQPDVRFCIARPGAVLTDQMNTPAGREGAAPVERVAGLMIRRLLDADGEPGQPHQMGLD